MDMDMLEKIQRRATKLIPGLRELRRMIEGMWSNNTGDAKIEGGQIEVFKILNGHENIDRNILFRIILR